jgi:hypothetical protein
MLESRQFAFALLDLTNLIMIGNAIVIHLKLR